MAKTPDIGSKQWDKQTNKYYEKFAFFRKEIDTGKYDDIIPKKLITSRLLVVSLVTSRIAAQRSYSYYQSRVYKAKQLENTPDLEKLGTRGVGTKDILGRTQEIKQELIDFPKRMQEEWDDFFDCMQVKQPNKYRNFLAAYGRTPSTKTINSVFNDGQGHKELCPNFEYEKNEK